MKTPIPEKIPKEFSVYGYQVNTAEETAINSLIDVVTEQQKENKKLTKRVEALEQTLNMIGVAEIKKYTAMRSTGGLFSGGDKKYCECDEPLTDSVYWKDKCFYCSKPIKSQEDVREKIAQLLIEIRESGESHRNWRHDVFTYVGLILAIVKGE